MKIRSLVNPDNVTITNCESEPIHIPGSIQPHGYLLGVSHSGHTIRYCSENCTTLFGTPLAGILGRPLSQFFSNEDMAAFTAYTGSKTEAERPFAFQVNGQTFHVTAFSTKQTFVLEFEQLAGEAAETDAPPFDLFIQTQRFAYHTERADNLQALCQDVADETRRITGYDRVMIYRFDEAHNGEIFAESKADGVEPFFGLHYPASDIPMQARELFLLNRIRLLADVQAGAVPLFTLDDGGGETNLDLSLSTLRSVSPMHIQYLKNMGVGATFNVALIHHGKLWGLIACHHHSPKHIAYHTRLAAHLQGIFLSSQIDVRQVADEFELMKTTEQKIDEVKEALAGTEHAFADSRVLQCLKDLLNADGLAILYRNVLYKEGLLPGEQQLLPLLEGLSGLVSNGLFHTAHIAGSYPEAATLGNTVAGVVYLALGKNTKDCVVWTRQEREKTVHWGGDPNKAMDLNGGQLTPRKSFALWKEVVKGQSIPWRKPELDAASVICASLQHQLHLADMKAEEQRYRSLNERLQKANEELANMNWISTHDLKEPLRKIQMYASVILEKQGEEVPQPVKTMVAKMQTSAARMQALIEDLLAYTRVVNEEKHFVQIDLNIALEEVQAELKEAIEEKGATLVWAGLPVVKGINFQVHQLLVNLVNNAIKFGKEGVPPIITVSSRTVSRERNGDTQNYYELMVSDNGMGFNPAYRQELFKMFQRFHGAQIKGTGIGLAICQKIAEAHNGFIEASGEEGVGAVFSVYFPVQPVKAGAVTVGEQAKNQFK